MQVESADDVDVDEDIKSTMGGGMDPCDRVRASPLREPWRIYFVGRGVLDVASINTSLIQETMDAGFYERLTQEFGAKPFDDNVSKNVELRVANRSSDRASLEDEYPSVCRDFGTLG